MKLRSFEIIEHKDACALIARSHDLLSAREAVDNNLVQLVRLLSSNSPILKPPFFFATIEKYNVPVGFCIHANPDGLVVSDSPASCAEQLVTAVLGSIPCPRRIVGPPTIAGELASVIARQHGMEFQLSGQWQVFRLDNAISSSKANKKCLRICGCLRSADSRDSSLIEEMAAQYSQERESFLDVKAFVLNKYGSGELYVWDDGGPKTILTVSAASNRSIRISSLFTAPSFRGQGYASAAVFSVARRLKGSGVEFVVLTADIGAPIIRMYERLDFYPIARRNSYTLEAAAS